MALKRGFDALGKIEDRANGSSGDSVRWLDVKDGEKVKLRFLQELDESATGYHKENGLAAWAVEHVHPKDFRKKALCTADEGGCWACKQDWKSGWAPKTKLYINVLIERKNGEREVAVWSQGYGPKAVVVPMIVDQARNEDINSITSNWWTLRRQGEGKGTVWILMPQAPSDDIDVRDYADELFDLEKCVRAVPLEEQEAFYNTLAAASDDEAPARDEEPKGGSDYSNMEW